MALSILSQASALNPGSDLWIVPDLEKSQWTAKLDWYLNFQICKASRRQSPVRAEFLNTLIEQTELELPYEEKRPPCLMIASESLLPNKWVVILPWKGNLHNWTSEAFEIWRQLQEPSLRVFLPAGQSTGDLWAAWQVHPTVPDFTTVLD